MFDERIRVSPFVALALLAAPGLAVPGSDSLVPGAVYTSTNSPAGNEVAVYDRALDGVVAFHGLVPTGGTGNGMGLGNQGAVVLSQDERWLYVVNAGSHDLSVLEVHDDGLHLVDRVDVGGLTPVSVVQHDDLVYVVNAGTNSITGFRQDFDGGLHLLLDSRRRLSGSPAAPAQIGFSLDGRDLYVTEKATNRISHWPIDDQGLPGAYHRIQSIGDTPFGFAFGLRNQLIVSEAFGGTAGASTVSSYRRNAAGLLDVISPTVGAGETAACWIVLTPDGRLAFTSNTGSNSITSLRIEFDGQLSVLDPIAAQTDDCPLDMAITRDGNFLYVLDGGAGSIGDYSITSDGDLKPLPGSNAGLPAGASGLAVR